LTQGCLKLIDTTVDLSGWFALKPNGTCFWSVQTSRPFFGRRSVANSNANGEHQNPSWSPSWSMSIRIVDAILCWISHFRIVRHLRSCGTLRLKYHRKQPSKN